MDIDFAFICDYADVSGKINALGIGFDAIYASRVPATHPLFYLVVQLRASVAEAGEKDTEVRLIDADGKDVFPPIRGPLTVSVPPPGAESKVRLAVAFSGITFPHYGDYALHVLVAGHEMVRIPFRVLQPPSTA